MTVKNRITVNQHWSGHKSRSAEGLESAVYKVCIICHICKDSAASDSQRSNLCLSVQEEHLLKYCTNCTSTILRYFTCNRVFIFSHLYLDFSKSMTDNQVWFIRNISKNYSTHESQWPLLWRWRLLPKPIYIRCSYLMYFPTSSTNIDLELHPTVRVTSSLIGCFLQWCTLGLVVDFSPKVVLHILLPSTINQQKQIFFIYIF